MFRLDPQHTGRSGYALPHPMRVVQRIETHGRISAQAIALPDGGVAVGSHDGMLYAGESVPDAGLRWRFATGDRIYTTPLRAADGTLFFGTDADRFVAVTARGRLSIALATTDDADTSATECPDGSLRFASGRALYATAADLTVRWRLDLGGKIFSSPAVAPDGTTYVGSQDDALYAVGPDGVVRWRVSTGNDVDFSPTIDPDGTIFVGGDDGVMRALRPDGTERWHVSLGGFLRAGAALGLDGTVIVPTYGPRTRVVALDRATGEVVWQFGVSGPPTEEYGIASAPLVDRDGRVAFGAPDDALYVLERDGRLRTRIALPADVDAAPVLLSDGVLAVGCDDGSLYVMAE